MKIHIKFQKQSHKFEGVRTSKTNRNNYIQVRANNRELVSISIAKPRNLHQWWVFGTVLVALTRSLSGKGVISGRKVQNLA